MAFSFLPQKLLDIEMHCLREFPSLHGIESVLSEGIFFLAHLEPLSLQATPLQSTDAHVSFFLVVQNLDAWSAGTKKESN